MERIEGREVENRKFVPCDRGEIWGGQKFFSGCFWGEFWVQFWGKFSGSGSGRETQLVVRVVFGDLN